MSINVVLVTFLMFLSIATVLSVQIPRKFIQQNTTPETQSNAVKKLVHRTLKEKAKYFDIFIDENLATRKFQLIKTPNNKIQITASDGISASKGFHHYLKYYLSRTVHWYNRPIDIDDNIDLPYVNYTSESYSAIIYYQNVCTWGYSFVWWNWAKWVEHIDWMAMMGINLIIAPIQEQLWYETFLELGLTEEEINSYMSGPAFLPWMRMGNIHGWGGPLGPTYRRMQMILQKKIIKQQRNIGMIVAVPTFSGHVPITMKKIYPNSNFATIDRWNKFPQTYCCALFLAPNDPLFQNITHTFLKKVIDNYGTDHIYFADPFNEIEPQQPDPIYLNMTAYNIYQSMYSFDTNAVWLMQGWMFVKNIFWSDNLIKSFLTAVPLGGLLVLDLQSEQFPQYERTHSYYGHSFIWCMLHNFGGTLGMHGSADIINSRIEEARLKTISMLGVGITPEGINQNYVMYALALERAWLKESVNLTKWFNIYSDVQYGIIDEKLRDAWQILKNSVYSYRGLKKIRGKYVITRRPSLRLNVWTWYNISDIYTAWSKFLLANSSIPNTHYNTYKHDLVDITRQFLQVFSDHVYINLIDSFKQKQTERFFNLSQMMLNILDDMESILSTYESYLLGPFLENAKSWASTTDEKEQFEFNARNQITLWGPSGQIVDYATKQWSGIVKDFFKPRWELFLNQLKICLSSGKPFNTTLFNNMVLREVEIPFNYQKKRYPTLPHGNTYNVSEHIFMKWSKYLFNNLLSIDLKIYK